MTEKRSITDPAVQGELCGMIRSGTSRTKALQTLGISPAAFARYWRDPKNVDFRANVQDAYDRNLEPIWDALREVALDGDVSAMREYLKHHAGPTRAEIEKIDTPELQPAKPAAGPAGKLTIEHKVDPKDIKTIEHLQALLEGRADDDIEDAEILDFPELEQGEA